MEACQFHATAGHPAASHKRSSLDRQTGYLLQALTMKYGKPGVALMLQLLQSFYARSSCCSQCLHLLDMCNAYGNTFSVGPVQCTTLLQGNSKLDKGNLSLSWQRTSHCVISNDL